MPGLLSAYGIGHSALESVKEKLVLKKLREVLTHLERDSNYAFRRSER